MSHPGTPVAAHHGPGSAPLLGARDLTKSYAGRPVLDGVALTSGPGQRLGLVGENGAGKTTLLRLLAGLEEPDAGTVARPPDTGFLHQEPPYPSRATLATVLAEALAESHAVERELTDSAERLRAHPEEPEAARAYAAALERAEALDVWSAERRAEQVLAGLGLAAVATDRPLGALSGGQRSRLALAALLIRRPRALLLDEPTNHLDDEAVAFLERYLAALPGAVVLASHDRAFLDAVCTGLLDLDPARDGPTFYGGAYSYYLRQKRQERLRWEQRHREEQEELGRLREAVRATAREVAPGRARRDADKMGYDFHGGRVQKQVSRRVRNAQRRLAELERDQVARPPRPLELSARLTSAAAGGELALIARDVEVPGRLRLEHLDLPADGRLLVTGANGAGKSTLLAVLARLLTPRAGSVQWLGGATVVLLEQDVTFAHPHRTARQLYADAAAGHADPPALVELGLVAPRDVDRAVGELSVGQRRRLALALLVARGPRVLLLDEPTNHISLALAEELEQALREAPGAVVVATHDRWLRRGWEGDRLHLADGRVHGRAAALGAVFATGGGAAPA